ncbi:MAG TPA: PKD domain-containing protein [Solirubrobacterales bacterium]|nr:PKD domain-containing protein [Solirubrobacterales bacterium]
MPLRISSALRTLLVAALALACCAPAAVASTAYVGSEGNSISVFDTASGALGAPVAIGANAEPFQLAISPNGQTLYSANYEVDTVSVIATASKAVVATIPVGEHPFGIAVTPDGSRVYVTNAEDDNVSVIATATNQVIGASIPVGDSPFGIAISPDGTRALVTNSGDDTVSVINLASGQVVATVPAGDNPYGLAYTPDGSRALIANNDAESISVLDGHTGQSLAGPIHVGKDPSGVAVSPNGLRAYVANYGDGSMSVINLQTNAVVSTPSGSEAVEWPAITPDGTRGFLSSYGAKGVLPFGTSPDPTAFSAPIVTSTEAAQIAITPNQGPVASFGVQRLRPGVAGSLNAAASKDPDGAVTSFAWNFGDGIGATSGSPVVGHAFAKPGKYQVQLTITDNEGCSTSFVFTGQTASCNGNSLATVTLPVLVSYPGVKARCPKSAGGRCTIALFAVKVGRKHGKPTVKVQSKPARVRLKAGGSRIVAIKPKAKFRRQLAKAKKITVLEAIKVGREITVNLRKLRVVR